jgi:hypothetical protein
MQYGAGVYKGGDMKVTEIEGTTLLHVVLPVGTTIEVAGVDVQLEDEMQFVVEKENVERIRRSIRRDGIWAEHCKYMAVK